MKCLLLTLAAFSAETLVARPCVDFAAEKPENWKVIGCVHRDAASQIAVGKAGFALHFDRRKTARGTASWGGLAPLAARRPELSEGVVRLTCRYEKGGIVRTPGRLNVIDAQGEIFPFAASDVVTLNGRTIVTYRIFEGGWVGAFFAGRPKAGQTLGQNRNERFDLPLRLESFTFGFMETVHEGDLTVEAIECPGATADSSVTVRAPVFVPVEGETRFFGWPLKDCGYVDGRYHVHYTNQCLTLNYSRAPGMKPFPATEDIVLKTSAANTGVVVMNLVDPATGNPMRIKTKWETESHFRTNLPPGRTWQLKSFEFWQHKKKGGGYPVADFFLESLTGVYRTSAAEACRLDVDTGNRLHVARVGRERVALTLSNPADRVIAWKGTLRCRDFFGRAVDVAVDHRVAPGETVRLPLPENLAKGIWRVYGEITADDGSTARPETRFAVLDEHPKTPRLPRGTCFRPGINWHAAHFDTLDRQLCEDALDACGCKLVRAGGFSFPAIEPHEGEFRWERSDTIMAETEAHGISLDTIVYGVPRWTQDTNRVAKINHFKKHMVPPREGTFGAFAEKVAARYGTKIDYYEIGNEWDLIPAAAFTRDEAVRVHREGYAGLKRGNPDVNVICNGWTSPDVRVDHYGKDCPVGKDFLAYVMARIKDNTSCFPIHMHCPFAQYRRKVQKFLELRRRLGCEHLPWYSNETALSSVNGQEDAVAKDVYRKMMYAWANGSIDYIWYNLKATGWVASDSEQGYGLITADFYPRAGYASFSAFSKVYLGLRFDGTLIDRATRLAYRFRGERDGVRQIVFGGWDDAAEKPCAIRVKTDAARAWQTDLMGNRTAAPVSGGVATWQISANPSSLVLEGATFAEADAGDLAAIPVPPGAVREIPPARPNRPADYYVQTQDRMLEYHQAIPEARHRLWHGADDLSMKVLFERQGDDVKVRVLVRDDVRAAGDRCEVVWQVPGGNPKARDLAHVSRKGADDVYEIVLPGADCGFDAARLREGVLFNVRLHEDDGEGPDGILAIVGETEPMKLLKFVDAK